MIYVKGLKRTAVFAMACLVTLIPLAAAAQTRVTMPKNRYKVQDDVKAGRDAAIQVEQQFPILNDQQAQDYVENIGRRLVAAIPSQFQQPEFQYRFKVVNAKDINAFALPGGPMYVNRGMIEAARNEGEMAGVMAHEISHVALRHATAQATKQGNWKNQLGMLGMIIGGAVVGGQTGAQLGMLGAQAWMTKYSREYESTSDILGAQIMAQAGYDPRDLANMFQTIAREGGGRGPEWLSSHPDPGDRFQKINREASLLRLSPNPIKITREFERTQSRLRQMPPAKTMAQIEQDYKNGRTQQGGQSPTAGGRYSQNVQYPAGMRTYSNGEIRLNVPSNWREFSGQGTITFAPEGAYGDDGITHGSMIGMYQSQGADLATASRNYVNGVLQANPYLSQRDNFRPTRIANRQGYVASLAGRSPITGRTELVAVYTVQVRSGDLLYFIAVAPEDQASRYSGTFRNMISSLQLNDYY